MCGGAAEARIPAGSAAARDPGQAQWARESLFSEAAWAARQAQRGEGSHGRSCGVGRSCGSYSPCPRAGISICRRCGGEKKERKKEKQTKAVSKSAEARSPASAGAPRPHAHLVSLLPRHPPPRPPGPPPPAPAPPRSLRPAALSAGPARKPRPWRSAGAFFPEAEAGAGAAADSRE